MRGRDSAVLTSIVSGVPCQWAEKTWGWGCFVSEGGVGRRGCLCEPEARLWACVGDERERGAYHDGFGLDFLRDLAAYCLKFGVGGMRGLLHDVGTAMGKEVDRSLGHGSIRGVV